jgi:GT2 family glycosyltransferase/glycosyltransferase involved in cell wall biosynthesis
MNWLRLSAKRFLRRAPLPNWLRVWLRPMGRRLPASLIRYILRAHAAKRVVSRVTPCDLPRLDAELPPFSVPAPRDPKISIVIPFHGEAALTLRCLYGLSRHETAHGFEVIAVDDGSDAAARQAVERVAGLRIVSHASAHGFVAACNAGAAAARGEFLLFLNNDTFPQPRLLDELVAAFALPQAGVVGAALIYPDGRLQEAGAIVWRDAQAFNIGRGQDPDDPDFCFAREVDYCSGACLMIRRELFSRLGGFDPRYAPAYYEDADLCFRVREAGQRVYVQPLARVVHVEGATAGSDPAQGIKRFQAVNRAKFAERWKERLRTAPEPVPFGTARFVLPGQRRILVVDHVVPATDEDAGSVILVETILLLHRLGYLVVLGAQRTPDRRDRKVLALERLGVEVIRAPYYRSVVEYISVHEGQLDLVFMVRHAIAEQILPQLDRLARTPTILLNPDLHYLRTAREAAIHDDAGLAKRAASDKTHELAVMRRVDVTITLSDAELALLRAELPEKHVALLPWIVRPVAPAPGYAVRRNLIFFGSFMHPPNADAIVNFVQTLWPALRARLPGVALRIVGSHQGAEIARLAGSGIEVVGHVADLQAELDRARVAIAPLRWGAGFKGKVATAMASGLPNVVSPVAAEGMGIVDGETCLIAELGPDFVAGVERLYNSSELWRSLSTNGLRFAASHWSPQQAETRLIDMLQKARVAPTLALSDRIEAAAARVRRSAHA